MERIVDLHTHLLPYMDDGAEDLKEAFEMTEDLYQQGVTDAVCTPHFDPSQQSMQDFLERRAASIALLGTSKVSLTTGSETCLHEYLFHYPDLRPLCIAGTRYILVELPYSRKWGREVYKNIERLIDYYNLIPVIAHIERYPAARRRKSGIRRLKDMGCILQMNAASLLEKTSERRAFRYIRKGYIDVIASDCHNLSWRPPMIAAAFSQIRQKEGTEAANRIMHNACCILEGISINPDVPYLYSQNILN